MYSRNYNDTCKYLPSQRTTKPRQDTYVCVIPKQMSHHESTIANKLSLSRALLEIIPCIWPNFRCDSQFSPLTLFQIRAEPGDCQHPDFQHNCSADAVRRDSEHLSDLPMSDRGHFDDRILRDIRRHLLDLPNRDGPFLRRHKSTPLLNDHHSKS